MFIYIKVNSEHNGACPSVKIIDKCEINGEVCCDLHSAII